MAAIARRQIPYSWLPDTSGRAGDDDLTGEARNRTFGDLLRGHRLEASLTQAALAELAGISTRAVQYLEGRNSRPVRDTVRRLADALKLSPEQAASFFAAARPTPRRRVEVQATPRPAAGPPHREDPPRATWPSRISSFIGREHLMAQARSVLLGGSVRLLTLTGPPGSGKTRLALELGASLTSALAEGALFVSLAPIADARLVIPTTAHAVGLQNDRPEALLPMVAATLAERDLLLVLDNFEHVSEAALDVAALLHACPRLRILVTSRAALRIGGEHELEVGPLSLPDPSQALPAASLDAYGAVALFVDRATAIRSDFRLTTENAATVAEICWRLDGLPLAIELAAGATRLLSPSAMLERLERRIPLQAGGMRDTPARHQTLHAAIAWSYDLLDADEQRLFRRLAVFVGGCTVEAATTVCGRGPDLAGGERSDLDTFSGLASLAAKSLVQLSSQGSEPRLILLETIRNFALEQLDASGEREAIEARHTRHFLALAERADPLLRGPEQIAWLDRLEQETDNFRAALARTETVISADTVAAEDAQQAFRLASALFAFWYLRGHVREGRSWLARLLPRLDVVCAGEAAALTSAAARAHFAAGWLALFQGDYAVAQQHDEQSVAIWRSLGQPHGLGQALMHRGLVAQIQNDLDAATVAYQESVALLRSVDDRRWLPLPTMQLGTLAATRGDIAGARTLLEEAVALAQRAGDRAVLGQSLRFLGDWHARLGEFEEAMQRYCEALELFRALRERWFTPRCLLGMAAVAAGRGSYVRAARLLGSVERLMTETGGSLYPHELTELATHVAAARQALGDSAFEDAWAHGQTLSLDEIIGFALAVETAHHSTASTSHATQSSS